MSEETLQDIIKRKNERIENLENKNQILFKQLYKTQEELGRLKGVIKERFEDAEAVLKPDNTEENDDV